MTRVAKLIKLTLKVFEARNVLEDLKLHSITLTKLSLAIYCMLNGQRYEGLVQF